MVNNTQHSNAIHGIIMVNKSWLTQIEKIYSNLCDIYFFSSRGINDFGMTSPLGTCI